MDYLESSSIEELEQLYKHETEPRVKTKLLAVIYRKEKKTIDETSKALRVSAMTVKRAVKRFRKEGKVGLYRKHGGGNPGYLTDNQRKELIKYIETNTPTSREANAYIKKEFGKSYHPNAVPKLLKSLGFSRITPRKRHYKTNKNKQVEWVEIFKKRSRNTWVWDTRCYSKTSQ